MAWRSLALRTMQRQVMVLLCLLCIVLFALIKGTGACPLYDLSMPEGSSGRLEINITEKSPVLCKMQSAVETTDPRDCTHLMMLDNKDTLKPYNSMFKNQMALSAQFVTVKKAQKWMAGEYRIVTSLHESCLARIHLTVLDPVSFPPPLSEPPASRGKMTSPTGEGSSHGTLTNGSAACEPRSLLYLVVLVVLTAFWSL